MTENEKMKFMPEFVSNCEEGDQPNIETYVNSDLLETYSNTDL